VKPKRIPPTEDCLHCWHPHVGPIYMVIPPGKVLEQCCKCGGHQTVHMGHAHV